jgi:hypothetical protein
MNPRPIGVLLGFLTLLAGCAGQSQFVPASGEMDRAFVYTEHDRSGHVQPLSASAKVSDVGRKEPAEFVPRPALVDMDSTIRIEVLGDRLAAESGGNRIDGDSGLLERKQRIIRALEKVGPVIEAQRAAIEAYGSASEDDFVALRRDFAIRAGSLLADLLELWPDENDPARIALEDAAEDIRGPYPGIRRFLNDQLRAIEQDDGKLVEQARSDSITLRLEAWLENPGNPDVPIHLDGYDDLDRGRIQQRDRLGLALSDEDISRLQAQFSQTREVAAAANAVLDKDRQLGEALLDIAPTLSSELGEIAARARRLADRFDSEQVRARLQRIRDAAANFAEAASTRARALSDQNVAGWPDEFVNELQSDIEAPGELIQAVDRVTALRDEWRTVDAGNLFDRIDSTLALFDEVRTGLDLTELPAVGEKLQESLELFLQKKGVELTGELQSALATLANGAEAQALRSEIEQVYQDIQQVQTIARGIKELLESSRGALAERTHVPEVRKVPVGDVQDTYIELTRTGRVPGDTVTVEATRFVTEQGVERESGATSASFRVDRFGWYAELSPAVVLVQPTRLVSDNDGFRFAPTLSWMAHYAPQPYKTGGAAQTWRALRPGFGIHAAFLNFDLENDESIQVGLGATLSLWQNRLQFGAGYNLMADSNKDGGQYFFIGSDLIGILQSMGLAGP